MGGCESVYLKSFVERMKKRHSGRGIFCSADHIIHKMNAGGQGNDDSNGYLHQWLTGDDVAKLAAQSAPPQTAATSKPPRRR
eukprot:1303733-Amphidinium_carterae.1